MKFSDLTGLPVVDLTNAEKLGTVDDALLDTQNQQVVGLQVRLLGLFPGHKIVPWQDVRAVGESAVTVENANMLQSPNQVPDLQNAPDASSIPGSKVMTATGQDVGKVSDIDIDTETGKIVDYVLAEGLLAHLRNQEHIIEASDVRSIGQNIIVVDEHSVKSVS